MPNHFARKRNKQRTPLPPDPDRFYSLKEIPAWVEDREGECFEHTTAVLQGRIRRRQANALARLDAQNQVAVSQVPKTNNNKQQVPTAGPSSSCKQVVSLVTTSESESDDDTCHSLIPNI